MAQLLPIYSEKQIELLGRVLQNNLIARDAQCAALLDLAGSIIVKRDNGRVNYDLDSIAVLAASNFSAVKAIAERIGESQFSLMYHKGKKGNVHLNEVMNGFLLVTIFGREVSVGNLRLMVDDTVKQIRRINYHFYQKYKVSQARQPSTASLPKRSKAPILGRLMGRFRKKPDNGGVIRRRWIG